MAVELYRAGTEFVKFPLTDVVGDLSGVTVSFAFPDSPSAVPEAADYVEGIVVTSSHQTLASARPTDGDYGFVLVGPRNGHVTLTPPTASPVDYQAWIWIATPTEDIVRKRGIVTVR